MLKAILSGVMCLLLLGTGPALAQSRADVRKAEIDGLLSALKSAPSEEAAAALQARIETLWLNAGSPAATLLMNRGLRDLSNNASDDALADFDSVLTLEPEFADAYRHRAMARFDTGDYAGAVADIQSTLQREPRDYAAFETLSRIAEARHDYKGALLAWQKAMEIDPKMPDGDKRLRELSRKVNGEAT